MSGHYATIPHRVKYPWYQKPLSKRRYQCGVLGALDTTGWISIVPGLDDFRSGPPTSEKGTIRPIRKLEHGVRLMDERSYVELDRKSATSSLSSDTAKNSNLSLQRRGKAARGKDKSKDKQMDFEQRLHENPMVLLPYLESNLPHEVFEKLVAMIGGGGSGRSVERPDSSVPIKEDSDEDPSKSISGIGQRRESVASRRPTLTQVRRKQSEASALLERLPSRTSSRESPTEAASGGTPDMSKEKRPSIMTIAGDPYRLYLKRREYGSPQTQKRTKSAKPVAARRSSESINVNKVAEDFCDWMRGVGGEDPKYNIDADKVITLFAIDTETKPTVSTAIQVLDQANIPEELMSEKQTVATTSGAVRATGKPATSALSGKPRKKAAALVKPTRYRYGAWYLEVESWKKLGVTQPLEDPEEVEKREAYEASLRSDEVDQQLGTLFSVRSLREYFRRTNIKPPHFLKNVPVLNYESNPGLGKTPSSV